MGVWIETCGVPIVIALDMVTPCVGVWIETLKPQTISSSISVTPCVGVWIETAYIALIISMCLSHTLRGCVD